MPDISGLNPSLGQQSGLKWKDAQHVINTLSDFFDALRTPSPDRRTNKVHRWDARLLELLGQQGQHRIFRERRSARAEGAAAGITQGRLTVDAVLKRDYPVVQCTVFLSAASFVMINFLIDVLYGVLDPRLRTR